MRNVAEAIRPDVRTSISPVPLYPFRRLNPPEFHAQLYAGVESPGRRAITPERDGILYLHIYARREEDIDSVYAKVNDRDGFCLDGWMVPALGDTYALSYHLASATLLEEDDGTLHLATLYTTRYYQG